MICEHTEPFLPRSPPSVGLQCSAAGGPHQEPVRGQGVAGLPLRLHDSQRAAVPYLFNWRDVQRHPEPLQLTVGLLLRRTVRTSRNFYRDTHGDPPLTPECAERVLSSPRQCCEPTTHRRRNISSTRCALVSGFGPQSGRARKADAAGRAPGRPPSRK